MAVLQRSVYDGQHHAQNKIALNIVNIGSIILVRPTKAVSAVTLVMQYVWSSDVVTQE